jgi:hypothetical protein
VAAVLLRQHLKRPHQCTLNSSNGVRARLVVDASAGC